MFDKQKEVLKYMVFYGKDSKSFENLDVGEYDLNTYLIKNPKIEKDLEFTLLPKALDLSSALEGFKGVDTTGEIKIDYNDDANCNINFCSYEQFQKNSNNYLDQQVLLLDDNFSQYGLGVSTVGLYIGLYKFNASELSSKLGMLFDQLFYHIPIKSVGGSYDSLPIGSCYITGLPSGILGGFFDAGKNITQCDNSVNGYVKLNDVQFGINKFQKKGTDDVDMALWGGDYGFNYNGSAGDYKTIDLNVYYGIGISVCSGDKLGNCVIPESDNRARKYFGIYNDKIYDGKDIFDINEEEGAKTATAKIPSAKLVVIESLSSEDVSVNCKYGYVYYTTDSLADVIHYYNLGYIKYAIETSKNRQNYTYKWDLEKLVTGFAINGFYTDVMASEKCGTSNDLS